MKLLTLNCHSWHEEHQEEKIKYLATIIVEKNYDIVAFQEVNQIKGVSKVDELYRPNNFMLVLLEEIKKLGGPLYYYKWAVSHEVWDKFEEGSCILSRYPIVEEESFFVTQSQDIKNTKARNILKVGIAYDDQVIDVFSCHMGWWHDEIEPFKYQADQLFKHINPSRLSFLMGDFNNSAYRKNEGYEYLIGYPLQDTYHLAEEKDSGATVEGEIAGWQGNTEDLRIDLILLSKALEVKSSKVIFNGQNKEVVSDHYGVEVEVQSLEY